MLLNLYQWAKDSYEVSSSKGFDFSKESYPRLLKEIVGELFEADEHLETLGDGAWFRNSDMYDNIMAKAIPDITDSEVGVVMLNSVEFELADVCLRILSLIGSIDGVVDFSYSSNLLGVESFDSLLLRVAKIVTSVECVGDVFMARGLVQALGVVVNWCKGEGINLQWCMKVKLNYNRNRPYLHKVA